MNNGNSDEVEMILLVTLLKKTLPSRFKYPLIAHTIYYITTFTVFEIFILTSIYSFLYVYIFIPK